MRKEKHDKKLVRSIHRDIDKLCKQHGADVVRYAFKKFDQLVTAQNRYRKEKRELRARLREIEAKTKV